MLMTYIIIIMRLDLIKKLKILIRYNTSRMYRPYPVFRQVSVYLDHHLICGAVHVVAINSHCATIDVWWHRRAIVNLWCCPRIWTPRNIYRMRTTPMPWRRWARRTVPWWCLYIMPTWVCNCTLDSHNK